MYEQRDDRMFAFSHYVGKIEQQTSGGDGKKTNPCSSYFQEPEPRTDPLTVRLPSINVSVKVVSPVTSRFSML